MNRPHRNRDLLNKRFTDSIRSPLDWDNSARQPRLCGSTQPMPVRLCRSLGVAPAATSAHTSNHGPELDNREARDSRRQPFEVPLEAGDLT